MELAQRMNFPWLMSNVHDKKTGKLLADGREKLVFTWKGRKVRLGLLACKTHGTSLISARKKNVSRLVRHPHCVKHTNMANLGTLYIDVVLISGLVFS